MAYFIFQKNSDNLGGTLYKIAENINDLNSLNINKDSYKIIEDSQSNFEAIKYGTKDGNKYNNDIIIYEECTPIVFNTKNELKVTIDILIQAIDNFLKNNSNHLQFKKWNDYKNQLNNLNLNSIQYPLNKSLEQYFKDLGQPSLHPLQIP